MTVHPARADDASTLRPLQERPDTTAAYDSTWTEQAPTQKPTEMERVMLSSGKIYVVLAVVLIIWVGLLTILFRTDRKIDRLERRLDDDRSKE
jgi:CcmD family protein